MAPKLWDPFSHLSDGCIDIVIVPQLSRTDAIGVGSSFATGRLFKDDHVAYVKATRFSLESMRGHIPINIDGEPIQVSFSFTKDAILPNDMNAVLSITRESAGNRSSN